MQKRIVQIVDILQKLYPDPKPFLNFRSPFESVVATILSAQCTDARVNLVTPALFKVAHTPHKMLALGQEKLISYIKSTGFFNAKSKSLLGMCEALIKNHQGKVPNSFEELQKLPGVGRKTASVVLSQAFGVPAFPVDRHVFRVANRLHLARAKTPEKTDLQLRKNIPQELWIPLHLQLIMHGRQICRPRPKCEVCPMLTYCPEGKQIMKKRKKTTRKIMHGK